jgi:hypothetical protein
MKNLSQELQAFSNSHKLAITADSYIIAEGIRSDGFRKDLVLHLRCAAEIVSGNYLIHIIDPQEGDFTRLQRLMKNKKKSSGLSHYWCQAKGVHTSDQTEPVTVTITKRDYEKGE